MVVIDFLIGIPSPKLHVPHMFKVMGSFGTGLASPRDCAAGDINLLIMGLDRAEPEGSGGGVTFFHLPMHHFSLETRKQP